MQDLNVVLKGNVYPLVYNNDFIDKLSELNVTFFHVIDELQKGEEELEDVQVDEEFFLVGESFSLVGMKRAGAIELTMLIPSSHVL